MPDPETLSSIEKIKAESNYLRGSIAEELANDQDTFQEPTANLLKHHGMYQQDDRDRRGAKDAQGRRLGKAHSLMIRVKIPGGRLTAKQFLAQLDLCDELAGGTARITDRQDVQIHGVPKRNLRATIRRILDAELTTLGACGDVERNVMCCPAPYSNDPVRAQMQELAEQISTHLLPQTGAYHEIWLADPHTGRKELRAAGPGQEPVEPVEPIYGAAYLPRKFKTAMALPEDNCVDAYTNDLAFLAVSEGARVTGYNVLVGGGLGLTPGNKRTFPALAARLAFAAPDEVVDVATAIVKVHRDFGNRSDRKRARLKYLLAERGLEWFKARVEEYYGRSLPGPHPVEVFGVDDHLGWHEQGDGRWFYGLNVENGRVMDRDGFALKTALREICRTYGPGIRLTAQQSILLAGLRPEDRPGLEAILRRHGVPASEEISTVRRWSMACVALPTCPLAVAESERVLPGLLDRLEAELARLGLSAERLTVRMTGCANGCARPYNADVGLVGRNAGKYTIYLGGRVLGDRLAFLYRDLVPLDSIPAALAPLFVDFKRGALPGEAFGDFCVRSLNPPAPAAGR